MTSACNAPSLPLRWQSLTARAQPTHPQSILRFGLRSKLQAQSDNTVTSYPSTSHLRQLRISRNARRQHGCLLELVPPRSAMLSRHQTNSRSFQGWGEHFIITVKSQQKAYKAQIAQKYDLGGSSLKGARSSLGGRPLGGHLPLLDLIELPGTSSIPLGQLASLSPRGFELVSFLQKALV